MERQAYTRVREFGNFPGMESPSSKCEMSFGSLVKQQNRMSFNLAVGTVADVLSTGVLGGRCQQDRLEKSENEGLLATSNQSHYCQCLWIFAFVTMVIFSVTVTLICFKGSSAEPEMQGRVSEMLNLAALDR